jgi:hypothetical protein
VLAVTGTAAAGQQLTLRGGCGGLDCEGITFADSSGRWHTRLELVTPKGKRTVRLGVTYSEPRTGEQAASDTLHFRKGALPQAAPQSAPPSKPTSSTGGQQAPAGGNPFAGPRTMFVIGDSLAVGMAQPLRAALDTWDVPIDGRIGRPLGEGMQILRETPRPSGSRGSHAILAMSLGTNDAPESVDALDADVRESVDWLGAHGCAIWATIARPPLGGVSYSAMNDRLEALAADPALAGKLLVVPWKQAYGSHKSWRVKDGVHATAEGYAGRAAMYAQAARSCAA